MTLQCDDITMQCRMRWHYNAMTLQCSAECNDSIAACSTKARYGLHTVACRACHECALLWSLLSGYRAALAPTHTHGSSTRTTRQAAMLCWTGGCACCVYTVWHEYARCNIPVCTQLMHKHWSICCIAIS